MTSNGCAAAVARGASSSRDLGRELGQVDGLLRHGEPAGVDPREVEQIGRELRQPRHLLAHLRDELVAGGRVDRRVVQQLEEAAEREERRAELVRGIRDELATSAVEARES